MMGKASSSSSVRPHDARKQPPPPFAFRECSREHREEREREERRRERERRDGEREQSTAPRSSFYDMYDMYTMDGRIVASVANWWK